MNRDLARHVLRFLTTGALVVVILSAGARPANACSCVGPNPVCSAYWQTDAVFVGEVLSISLTNGSIPLANNQSIPIQQRRVHVRVTEPFSGVGATEVDVETGMGGGDCGYAFRVGEIYLIFASSRDSKLSTGICSPTKPLSVAASDLAYLRSLKNPAASRARLYGTVIARDENENDTRGIPLPSVPYAGARVVATGPAGRFEATSDRAGAFEILAPPGRYDIAVEVPADKYASAGWRNVELKDARGCAELPVLVRSDGHVTGRILDGRGLPVPALTVELIPDNRTNDRFIHPRHVARTTETGAFEITQVPPGRYVIGFNLHSGLPYPRVIFGRAGDLEWPRVASLGPGDRVGLGDLTVPPRLRIRSITGVVRDPSGVPISGAKVYLKATAQGSDLVGEAATTNSDGRFSLAALEGYLYFLKAEMVREPTDGGRLRSSPTVAVPDQGTVNLTIVK